MWQQIPCHQAQMTRRRPEATDPTADCLIVLGRKPVKLCALMRELEVVDHNCRHEQDDDTRLSGCTAVVPSHFAAGSN